MIRWPSIWDTQVCPNSSRNDTTSSARNARAMRVMPARSPVAM